ncbi:S41 family peptidase [Myroides odoratus]|uniref:S41 family peptidase n=1 Tax=Myroides odoratus TaxID=256 RepID=UPI0039B12055
MRKFFWPLIVAISLSLGILLGGFLVSASQRSPGNLFTNHNKLKLNRLLDFIEQEYVDQVDTDSIVDHTVATILEQLDPHSVYIGKDLMKEVTESMQGSFVGIGVQYYLYQDSLAIIKPVDGGPSMQAGLLAGDRILKANNKLLYGKGITSDTVSAVLKGESGTSIQLQIFRKTTKEKKNIVVKREPIPIKSVDIAIKLDNQYGYIKINRFSSTTYEEFQAGLLQLLKEDIAGLIVDLRDNSGGYMDQSSKILNDLLVTNQTIVKTINRGGQEKVTKAKSTNLFTTQPLYILVNENSASASEIIAGAIQDNDRGRIVGRRTFGKGLVQRELMLGDGSAIRLTTARYYTPSGRSIQKNYKNGIEDYNNDFRSRYEHGELYAADSIKIADSLQFRTLKGRIVYGGGGIVPDLFVPIAKKHGEEAIVMMMKSGMVSYYVFQEIDKNRQKYRAMNTEELIAYLKKDQTEFNSFKRYLESNKLFFKLDRHKDLVVHYLIAEYLNQLRDQEAYFAWLLRIDPMILKIDES